MLFSPVALTDPSLATDPRVDMRYRRLATLLTAAMLLLTASGRAMAHVTLVGAAPAAGSHLAATPARVRLVFNEEVDAGLARITLLAASGETRLAAERDPADVHAVVATLAPLAPGAYRVRWHVVSDDGHPVDGSIDFHVGEGAHAAVPAAGLTEPPASPWDAAVGDAPVLPALARGVAVGSLMALAGLLLFMARDESPSGAATLRLARWLSLAVPLLLAAHALLWLRHAAPDHELDAESVRAGLESFAGRVEAWRLAAAVLPAWALWLARRQRLALFFAGLALVIGGATGHAAADWPLVAIPAKAIHLAAGGVWVGGVIWLVMQRGRDRGAFLRGAERVSAAALVSVVLVAASGLVQTVLFLPAVSALPTSAYGRVALLKCAGLLVLVAFGAHHRYRAMPSVERGGDAEGFVTTLRQELFVLAVVTLLGGLLAYTPPAPLPGAPRPSTTRS